MPLIARNAPETTLLAWTTHRLREQPGKRVLVAAAYGAALALWWLLFPHPAALFLPLVALTSALAEYLFPASYRLTTRGAHVSNGFSRLFIAWPDVQRATVGDEGVALSPLARASSPLAPFRGVRLRFDPFDPAHRETVTETMRRLWRAPEGSAP